jgi:hypothetical protein
MFFAVRLSNTRSARQTIPLRFMNGRGCRMSGAERLRAAAPGYGAFRGDARVTLC